MTLFCKPTRDVIAKYLLDDEGIRNSFIRALTPYKDVTSSQKIDNALRPLKLDQNLLNILKDTSFVSFLQVGSHTLPQETDQQKLIWRFFNHLRDNYDEISATLLDEKSPVSDVICKLSTGDHVLIEVQVENPGKGAWDKRALAYAAILYGSQLRRGQSWGDINAVLALNILGMGGSDAQPFWPKECYYKRHYRFENILKKPEIPIEHLQMIQYSLGNVDLDTVSDPEERAWLDFFKNAHRYNDIPKDCPEIMKLAYERIITDHLPPNIKDVYKDEDAQLGNYKLRFEEEREAGIEIGKVKAWWEMGLSAPEIAQKAGITLEKVEGILSQ